jgi:hypothetical protein
MIWTSPRTTSSEIPSLCGSDSSAVAANKRSRRSGRSPATSRPAPPEGSGPPRSRSGVRRRRGSLGFPQYREAIKASPRKYAAFEGGASRSEFWWFALAYYAFLFLIIPVLVVIGRGSTLDQASSDSAVETAAYFVLGLAFYVGLLLPYVAAAVRRLHDTDRSGWW